MAFRSMLRGFGSRRAAVAVVAAATAVVLCLVATPATASPSPAPGGWSAPLPGQSATGPLPAGIPPAFGYQNADLLLAFAEQPPPDLDELRALGPREKGRYGTYEDMLIYWRDKGLAKYGEKNWASFVRGWVQGINANKVGDGYEEFGNQTIGIAGSSKWIFNAAPPGAPTGSKPDAFSRDPAINRTYEYKWTGQLTARARGQLRDFAQNVDKLGSQLVVVFGQQPTPGSLRFLDQLNRDTAINKARTAKDEPLADAVVARRLPGTPQGVPIKDPARDKALQRLASPQGGGVLVAPGSGQLPVSGALAQAVEQSPDSPQDAAVRQSVLADAATERGDPDVAVDQPLGGVDFSTLELRYVSDTYQGGSGLRYAFSADPEPAGQTSYGGRLAARRASDSFFVWLELPTSDFTVNLNPDEPNRIIDATFGSTDAGRILLQADLQMKKTVAKLIHPDTPAGARFWAGLHGDSKCLSMRQWIVPAPATVRQDGNQLYILDAPLQVKLETDYVKSKGVGGNPPGCPGQSDPDTQYNEQLFRTTILPQVQQAVNTAPEYADLRRVYVSRIAAQWYRERSATKQTAYSDLIDKGDVSAWPATITTTPQDVFNQYVESYTKGEFNVTHTTRSGNTITTNTYVFGGVDFSGVPRDRLGASTFARRQPGLPTTVGRSVTEVENGNGDTTVWLGGESTAIPLTEIQAGVPSPARTTGFWLVLTAPLALWVVGGGLLVLRRRRRRPPPPAALVAGP